jgi:7 transmembrane sweet-taste receptor of 3 GCPR
VIVTANVVVLASWTAVAPLQMETQVKSMDMFGRSIETYSFCNWADSSAVPFYVTLGAINFGLLSYAMVVAWRAREISTEFSESEYIFKAMGAILLVCFVGIPVIIIASENPSAFFFVCSNIIFVASTSILLLIFCPKLSVYYKGKRPLAFSLIPERFRRSASSSRGSLARPKTIESDGNDESPEAVADVRVAREIVNGVLDSSIEAETGVLIMANPKTNREFRSEIEMLKSEVERLQTEVKRYSMGAVSLMSMVSDSDELQA